MKIFFKVKTLIIVIILYQLVKPMIYAQDRTESLNQKTPSKISECLQLFDSLSSVQNKSLEKSTDVLLKGITGNKLKHVANLIYAASEEDYLTYMDSLVSISLKIKGNDKKTGTHSFTPGFIQLQTLYKVRDSLSPLTYGLAWVAYFLKVQVINVREEIPPGKGAYAAFVKAIVKDVYKGNSKFKIGDNIEFYFYNSWVLSASSNHFNADQEYIVPLEPRNHKLLDINIPLALVTYLDKSKGFYPIFNGYLIDKFNFFGFGEKIEYKAFDQKLRNKIEEIKSW